MVVTEINYNKVPYIDRYSEADDINKLIYHYEGNGQENFCIFVRDTIAFGYKGKLEIVNFCLDKSSADNLVEIIQKCTKIKKIAFSGEITRDNQSFLDNFQIIADSLEKSKKIKNKEDILNQLKALNHTVDEPDTSLSGEGTEGED